MRCGVGFCEGVLCAMPSVNKIYLLNLPLRDETLQEQLWEISVNAIRTYLSPEILERYGEAFRGSTQSATVEGRQSGNEVEPDRAVEQTEQAATN